MGNTLPSTPVAEAYLAPDPCVEQALYTALILKNIFQHCAARKDLKTLLVARSVCKTWKQGVMGILHENYSLLPKVHVSLHEYLYNFLGKVAPATDLPLQLTVLKWNPEVAQFMQNYSARIITIYFDVHHGRWEDFSIGNGITIELPQLRHVTLRFIDTWHNLDSLKVKNALNFLEQVIRESTALETCEVNLICQPHTIGTDDTISLFPLPRQTTAFFCANKGFFESLMRAREFPRMKKIWIPLASAGNHSSDFVDANVNRIEDLNISGPDPAALVGPGIGGLQRRTTLRLSQPLLLRYLTLCNVSVSGTQPSSTLLPELRVAKITEPTNPYVLTSLCLRGEVFQNLVEMELHQLVDIPLNDFQNQIHLRVQTLKTGFPNLTRFTWYLATTEAATVAASHVFSNLDQLKSLEIHVEVITLQDDVLKLLTGRSKRQIPWFSSAWPDALVGRQDSITNLPRLQKLTLTLLPTQDDHFYRLSSRESAFLFAAAFTKMDSLTELVFNYCEIENDPVKQQWRNSGRILIEDLD